MDGCALVEGQMSRSIWSTSSPPHRTKQVGFASGYMHSLALSRHLRQDGISFPHLRFAVAQVLHALVSRAVAMLAAGESDSRGRDFGLCLARLSRLGRTKHLTL